MRIGIVGAGMIGSTVARLWVNAGDEVLLASRHPETLAVFTAWGIDSCCGGGHPVEAVVQRHQLDGEALCNALVQAIGGR